MSSLSGIPVPTTPGGTSSSTTTTDTRRKQSRRDETLRRKIESELSRKRPGPNPVPSSSSAAGGGQSSYFGSPAPPAAAGGAASGGTRSSRKAMAAAQKGTVASLKPSAALTVPEAMTVSDASQLCAAKRTDCVLVVDDEEGLSGIFTAKDLAFRVSCHHASPPHAEAPVRGATHRLSFFFGAERGGGRRRALSSLSKGGRARGEGWEALPEASFAPSFQEEREKGWEGMFFWRARRARAVDPLVPRPDTPCARKKVHGGGRASDLGAGRL